MSIGLLYLFVKLDSIICLCVAIGSLSCVVILVYGVFGYLNFEENFHIDTEEGMAYWKTYKKILLKICLPILVVSIIFSCLIPSTKEIAFIYIVNKISTSDMGKKMGEKALQLPEKALAALTIKMNEYIKDQATRE